MQSGRPCGAATAVCTFPHCLKNGFGETDAMRRTVVRKYEFRGRDAHGNPCFDVVFVERDAQAHYVSSHLLPRELAIDGLTELLTLLRQWYTEAGLAQLRYQLIWEDGLPYPQSDDWSEL